MGTCRRLLLKSFPVIPLLFLTALPSTAFGSDLTFEDRVAAQEAIERVYYAHQIGATQPFEEAVPRAVLEEKVRTYLKKSVALEDVWHTRITGEMLRAEVERMARETRLPERLRELFDALKNDPLVVEECLARPILVNRLVRERFSFDRNLHEEARREAEDLRMQLLSGRLLKEPVARRSVTEFVRSLSDTSDTAAQGSASARGPSASVKGSDEPSSADTVELSPEEFAAERARAPAEPAKAGAIEEEPESFVIRSILEDGADRFRVATYRISKVPLDIWWSGEKDRFNEAKVETVTSGTLPEIAKLASVSTGCLPDNIWEPGYLQGQAFPPPADEAKGLSVWTGSLMIQWGGSGWFPKQGVRYDPTTSTWTPTSLTNAPAGRSRHTAVWTGSRMIIWGGLGESSLSSGGLYDPVSDTWQPTSTTGAPLGRMQHTAVWTGSRMLVYGGRWFDYTTGASLSLDDGGSYDPQTNTWTSIPPAPTLSCGRVNHAAVWTGSEMLIWGGWCETSGPFNDGARYNPVTNLWTAMSTVNAPTARGNPGYVWTGSRMLIWSGGDGYAGAPAVSGGGRYDPAADSWSPISTVNAPQPAEGVSVVWTGSSVIAWGGHSGVTNPVYYNAGGRYDPLADTWSPTTTVGAPSPRASHGAIWTGSLMVIWGGSGSSDANVSHGRYDPIGNTWLPDPMWHSVSTRARHSAVWTGTEMIVWGGPASNTGDRYDPATYTWSGISTLNAPDPREYQSTVWTGTEMIIWGGRSWPQGSYVNTGGRYNPVSDTWAPTSLISAPSERGYHTAVWTGTEMIVWGGGDGSAYFDSGGRYDPVADTWAPTQLTGAPQGRSSHTAVWTGSRMIVWGGIEQAALNTGGLYDPTMDAWTPTSTTNAPSARSDHGAVWTGSLMLIWGPSNTGGRYDPATDTWTSMSVWAGLQGRYLFTMVWTNSLMIVWGGYASFYSLNTGGRYDPVANTWTATPSSLFYEGTPGPRSQHTAVWAGDHMLVWGGCNTCSPYYNDGGALSVNPTDTDGDHDTYTVCAGDCNDSDPGVHPGVAESCNNLDDDCNGTVDGFSTACGIGACHTTGTCVMGVDDCTPGPTSPEACNGIDDDCNGFLPSDEIDGDGDGVRICQNDCSDANAQLWATPGEVEAVTFKGPTTMTWQIPSSPGSSSVVYDVIRSTSKSVFTTGATCPYTNGTSTGFSPSATPSPGQAYYFLVRAENACPQGLGSVGNQSNGTPRTARACP